ncbi:MAG: Enoyl-CoA hydratase/isomerase [Actinomycetia bacterium]|nr:Enoyl-CoA hydratase/isomerase [Actinomycetes bacterium]
MLVDVDGPVRIVRLNRPEALNAADPELHARLAAVWTELAADGECRAVVLTGNGRAFCAGGDLGVLVRMNEDPEFRTAIIAEGAEIVRNMAGLSVPIVAAVNGPAVGLGCSLAGLSDIVLIESSAYLADPHVSVGLVAGDGAAITWPLLTSLIKAKEYLFTGDRIPADVAVELGFANRVVPDGESVEQATALAHRLAKQPAQALRDTKRAINKHLERSIVEILDFALEAETVSSASAEHRAIVDRMRKPREG